MEKLTFNERAYHRERPPQEPVRAFFWRLRQRPLFWFSLIALPLLIWATWAIGRRVVIVETPQPPPAAVPKAGLTEENGVQKFETDKVELKFKKLPAPPPGVGPLEPVPDVRKGNKEQ